MVFVYSNRMAKSKEQRVAVLVDIQNLYYSAKALYGKKVNFKNVLEEAVAGRKFIRAIAYGIKTVEGQEEKFFDALEKHGFEVKKVVTTVGKIYVAKHYMIPF